MQANAYAYGCAAPAHRQENALGQVVKAYLAGAWPIGQER